MLNLWFHTFSASHSEKPGSAQEIWVNLEMFKAMRAPSSEWKSGGAITLQEPLVKLDIFCNESIFMGEEELCVSKGGLES